MDAYDIFLRQVLGGVATGSIYGSLALALVMIYQSTQKINFAQGEMAMFSTYIAWWLIAAGLPYWFAFIATVAVALAVGAVVEYVVIRRISGGPPLSVIAVFIGLLLIFHSAAGAIFGNAVQQFPSPFHGELPWATRMISLHALGMLAVNLAVLLVLFAFFRFTRLGLAMRASAFNPVSSQLSGIPVPLMFTLGWGGASAVGAVAGMMVAPITYLDPDMMGGVLIYSFAGALLGGLTSPGGAMLGGIVVGVLENILGAYVIGTELKLPAALALILAVLLVWPAGLFGRKIVARV
jgi:branched-chain amino acid transport system permease protein